MTAILQFLGQISDLASVEATRICLSEYLSQADLLKCQMMKALHNLSP